MNGFSEFARIYVEARECIASGGSIEEAIYEFDRKTRSLIEQSDECDQVHFIQETEQMRAWLRKLPPDSTDFKETAQNRAGFFPLISYAIAAVLFVCGLKLLDSGELLKAVGL